jgi:hypothetical protein
VQRLRLSAAKDAQRKLEMEACQPPEAQIPCAKAPEEEDGLSGNEDEVSL